MGSEAELQMVKQWFHVEVSTMVYDMEMALVLK